jgi:Zn-dependent protease with chaperone function
LQKFEANLIKKIIFFFFLLLTGCAGLFHNGHLGNYTFTHKEAVGHPEIIPVYLDKNFGESDKIQIADALNQWNYVLNGNASFKLVDDCYDMNNYLANRNQPGLFIIKITSHFPHIPIPRDCHLTDCKTLAFALPGGNYIFVVREYLENDDLFFIILHEVGHVLGSHHTSDGLMSARFNKEAQQCVDQTALPEIAAFHHWKIDTLNYCY